MQKPQPTPSSRKNDPHKLLVQYGAGRTTADYQKNQNIFVQGQVADTVFFIQKGRVKVTERLRAWHIASVGAVQRFVWSWCYTGSDQLAVKTALLSRRGHAACARRAARYHQPRCTGGVGWPPRRRGSPG
jgi:hypothetical protein